MMTFKERIELLAKSYDIKYAVIREVGDGVELHYSNPDREGKPGELYMEFSLIDVVTKFAGKWLRNGNLYMQDNYLYIPEEGQVFTDMDDEDFELWRKLQ